MPLHVVLRKNLGWLMVTRDAAFASQPSASRTPSRIRPYADWRRVRCGIW